MNSLADGLRRDLFDSSASNRHNVDRSLVVVSKRPKKMSGREAKALQQGAHDALRSAADVV